MLASRLLAPLVLASALVARHVYAEGSAWSAIREEERWLGLTFGDEFHRYAGSVPRFVPKPWLLSSPPQIIVDPARLLRALVESSLVLLVFPLARIVEWCHASALLPVIFRVP